MKDARAKALVVEDDATTRTLLVGLLESIDCEVDIAADGEEALQRLQSRHYDVILLDIVLPKMTGIDVMESLRRDHPHILGRIIVVTGLDIREIRTLFPSVHETLSKPVIPNRLRQAVRSGLRR
jgi:CheY-like chemotaxis protein